MPIHNFEWQLRMTTHIKAKPYAQNPSENDRDAYHTRQRGTKEGKDTQAHILGRETKKNRNLETHNPDSSKHIWGLEGSKTLGTHNPESTKTESMPNLRDKRIQRF